MSSGRLTPVGSGPGAGTRGEFSGEAGLAG
jgi:hypothetical protein